MKKLLLILFVAVMAMACSKNDDPQPRQYQPHKTYINGVATVNYAKSQELRDLKYIVKNANVILFYNDSTDASSYLTGFLFDNNRDTVNMRFVYDEFMIVQADGTLNKGLVCSRDMVYVKRTSRGEFELPAIDTLAYTPNSVLRRAEKLVKEAYAKKDWETCYAVMDTTFKFYPITGEKWRELKRKGIE